MKKIFFIGIIAFSVFISCQKGTSNEKYHVTYTVDGTTKTYTGYVGGTFDTASGYISLKVLGSDSANSFDHYIGFYLDNYTGAKGITTGQYDDTETDFTLLSSYTINSVSYEAGQTVASDAMTNNVTITNHFKVTISSLTKSNITGTFSGDFYEDGDVLNGKKVTITNGEFYVKLQ